MRVVVTGGDRIRGTCRSCAGSSRGPRRANPDARRRAGGRPRAGTVHAGVVGPVPAAGRCSGGGGRRARAPRRCGRRRGPLDGRAPPRDPSSRASSARGLVVRAIAALPAASRPRLLVSASAVGWYGDRGDETLTEDAPRGGGFLADVCEAWEHEAFAAATLGVGVTAVRIGIVLGRDGGALARVLPPFRLGLGGRLGNGAPVDELDPSRRPGAAARLGR